MNHNNPKQKQISVVIPIYSEKNNKYLMPIINLYKGLKDELEVLFVDSSSIDGTKEFIEKNGFTVLDSKKNSRAARLNLGITKSKNSIIFLNHPRSLPDPKVFDYMKIHFNELTWGGLTHQFDFDHRLLKFTSWYSNNVRRKTKGIIYLDHCIFFKRDLLTQPIPEVDIFEDTLLSLELLKAGKPVILPYTSITSALRFKTNGIYRQAFINQALKVGYSLSIPHALMNKLYERGLGLNTKY